MRGKLAGKQMNSTAEIVLQQGKYRINHTLDRGEFGITYRATHVQLGQAVAIKTLRPSLRHHPDFAQYYHHFRAVTHRLSQCHHPNLIRVLDVFEEKGLPFMVMNYVEGSSLAEKLQSRSPLPVDQALYYVRQIAAALQVIHDSGLLHCNLKPQAVLQRTGSDGVTLIDFGINSSLTERTPQPYRGNRNLPGGFAALEQYLPHETLTPATDIYGLTAVLYYLLTGQPPLEAPLLSSQGTVQWFSQTQPILKRLHPELNPAVEQMILAGLEVEPSNRPQTIDHWLALMPNLHPSYPPVESSSTQGNEGLATAPNPETVANASSALRQPRFLVQLLWLQRCTPIVFVITAILFGWLGFSLTRRYTQMVFYNVHQKFDSEQNGADWFKEGFSDYDPSKPMFEDPSVETRKIEPELVPGERHSDLDFEQADRLDSEGYNSEEEWYSEWEQNPSSDVPQRRVYTNRDPYSYEYERQPTDEYGWESGNIDSTPSNNNEWETSEGNTWEEESNPEWDESKDREDYDYNYQYNYNSPVPNPGTSGYSGYTTDLSPENRYEPEPETISDYKTSTSDERPIESNSYNSSDYNAEYETDWNGTPAESSPDPSNYNRDQTPSYWTPEPTIDPQSSSSRWTPSSEEYNVDPVVELSIPEASSSFSEFETDSTASPSSLGLEEVAIPNRVTRDYP
jgi:serine/threonine protein kinase